MSEHTLTTGQMIDQLEVGQTAENVRGYKVAYVGGRVMYVNDKGEVERTHGMDGFFNVYKEKRCWRILPTYVSFDEAMAARRQGKTVQIHKEGKMVGRLSATGHSTLIGYNDIGRSSTIDDLLEGQWLIEEDTK